MSGFWKKLLGHPDTQPQPVTRPPTQPSPTPFKGHAIDTDLITHMVVHNYLPALPPANIDPAYRGLVFVAAKERGVAVITRYVSDLMDRGIPHRKAMEIMVADLELVGKVARECHQARIDFLRRALRNV